MTPNLYAKPCTMRQERMFYIHPDQSSEGAKLVNNLTSISYYPTSTEIESVSTTWSNVLKFWVPTAQSSYTRKLKKTFSKNLKFDPNPLPPKFFRDSVMKIQNHYVFYLSTRSSNYTSLVCNWKVHIYVNKYNGVLYVPCLNLILIWVAACLHVIFCVCVCA